MRAAKKKASVTIKDTVVIGGKAFRITEIKGNAFSNNNKLKKVVIGKNVAKIGKKAFYNCKNLSNIRIHSKKLSKKGVGKNAFGKTSAKMNVKVPKGKKGAYKKFMCENGCSDKTKFK